jgi:hypothetical protein
MPIVPELWYLERASLLNYCIVSIPIVPELWHPEPASLLNYYYIVLIPIVHELWYPESAFVELTGLLLPRLLYLVEMVPCRGVWQTVNVQCAWLRRRVVVAYSGKVLPPVVIWYLLVTALMG